jgi:thiol-disulfide isomerase/thioredoxin
MTQRFALFTALILASARIASAQDWDSNIIKKVAEIETQAARQSTALRIDALLEAAVQVKDTHPDLSQRIFTKALADLNKNKDVVLSWRIASSLVTLKGEEGAAKVLPPGRDRSNYYLLVINSAMQRNDFSAAGGLSRKALADGAYGIQNMINVLRRISEKDPAAADALFADAVKAFPWKSAKVGDYLWILNCAAAVAEKNPAAVASFADRIAARMEMADEHLGVDQRLVAKIPVPRLYPTARASGKGIFTTTARDLILFEAAAFLRVLDAGEFDARSKQFQQFSDQMEVIKTWKPSDLARLRPNFMTYESKSDPVPGPSLPTATTSLADGVSAIEKAEMPAMRVRLLVNNFSRANLTPEELAFLTKHGVAALDALPYGLDRMEAASSVFFDGFDYPVSQEIHNEAGKAYLDALSKIDGRQRELTKQYRQRGVRPDDPVADGLMTFAYHLPDYQADGPLAEPLELYRNLWALRNLRDEKIDFQLTGLDGKAYRLSDHSGKVVILNFWATWCAPCQREMPTLESLHKNGNKDLAVLAISDEESKIIFEYAASKGGYTMPLLLDSGGKVHDRYGRRGIPHTVIIGRDGKIVKQFYGMRSEAELLQDLHAAGLP